MIMFGSKKYTYTEGESNPCRLLIAEMEGKHDNRFTIGVIECLGLARNNTQNCHIAKTSAIKSP